MRINSISGQLKEYINTHKRKKKWLAIVTGMAAVVVFCTVYALVLPAITLEDSQNLDCTYEVHQHDESCYDEENNLICGYADYVVHTHDRDTCYDSEGNLICPLSEVSVHEHDASCYEEQTVLICGQEENNGHVHDSSCYESTRGSLICENTEEGHVHTDECYAWTEELVCGMEEGEGAHVHDASCYGTETVLVCDKPEVILHTHTDLCYEDITDENGNVTGKRLICGMLQVEEHQHTDMCYNTDGDTTNQASSEEISPDDDIMLASIDEGASEDTPVLAADLSSSSFLEGTCSNGVTWSITPAVDGGYKLSFTIPEGVTPATLPSDLFTDVSTGLAAYKDSITSVEIPPGITAISENAFSPLVDGAHSPCVALRTVTFLTDGGVSQLTSIGNGAFSGCEKLTSLNLGDCTSLTKIGDSVTGANDVSAAADGVFYNTGLKNVTIPSSVQQIADCAFNNCKNLTNVNIEANNSMTDMGAYVFAGCTALKSVNLENLTGENLTFDTNSSISNGGNGLFSGCTSLTTLTLPNMTGSIAYLCDGCTNLTSINLDKCTKLQSGGDDANDASSVTTNPMYCFVRNCGKLKELDLSHMSGLKTLYRYTVLGGVEKVILPPELVRIASQAFAYTNVKEIVFAKNEKGENSLALVGGTKLDSSWAATPFSFGHATKLKDLDLEFGEKGYLLSGAFLDCSSLENLTISSHDGLDTLGADIFQYCNSLTDITWDVKSVDNLFLSSTTIPSDSIRLTIGPNVEKISYVFLNYIKDNVSEYVFSPNHSFYVTGGDTGVIPLDKLGCYYADANGNLYRLDAAAGTAELVYASRDGSGAFTVPAAVTPETYYDANGNKIENTTHSAIFTVTGVGTDAFKDTSYTSITFENPENITTLSDRAFADAYNLASVNEQTVDTDVISSFANAAVTTGENLFTGTKIGYDPFESTGATKDADGLISVTANTQVEIKPSAITNSRFSFATGEAAQIDIIATHTDKSSRVYFKVSDAESLILSTDTQLKKVNDRDDIYYYDVPSVATTTDRVSTTIPIAYKDNVTPNKKIYVWVVEADGGLLDDTGYINGTTLLEPGVSYSTAGKEQTATASTEYLEATWDTVIPGTYTVKKEAGKSSDGGYSAAIKDTYISGATCHTVTGLSYTVTNQVTDNRTNSDGTTYTDKATDFVDYVTYTDTLTLPAGLSFRSDIDTNNITYALTSNDRLLTFYAHLTDGKSVELCSVSMSVDTIKNSNITCSIDKTTNTLSVAWTTENQNKSTEISSSPTTILYGPDVIVVSEDYAYNTDNIDNAVTATPSFTYSGVPDGVAPTAQAVTGVRNVNESIKIDKEWITKPSYQGETAIYNITVENQNATSYTGSICICDKLTNQYIDADTMEEMFAYKGDSTDGTKLFSGDYLTIEIRNAHILELPYTSEGERTVTAVDGATTGKISVDNTGENANIEELAADYAGSTVLSKTATIKITKNERGYIEVTRNYTDSAGSTQSVTYTVGNTDGTDNYYSIQDALDALGYVVSDDDFYLVTWNVEDDSVTIPSNTKCGYTLKATTNDSLQALKEDVNLSIASGQTSYTYKTTNDLYDASYDSVDLNLHLQKELNANSIFYDLLINKYVYDAAGNLLSADDSDGENQNSLAKQSDGSIIKYEVNIEHMGDGCYDLLPVTDHMSGMQAVLAPVSLNSGAAWATTGCLTYTDNNGIEYYVLNAEGATDSNPVVTYDGVWLSNGYADSVTVSKSESGLDTWIRWYYMDIRENSTIRPSYNAIISQDYAGNENTILGYKLNNETWANDLPSHRIRNDISTGVVTMSISKNIVSNKGATPDTDELWNKYVPYTLHSGDSVTYRLEFNNTGGPDIRLTGEDFYDMLPSTKGIFEWSKDGDAPNVAISYGIREDAGGTGHIEIKYNGNDIFTAAGDGSEYSVGGVSPKDKTTSDGTYYITWDNNFEMIFPSDVTGSAYIYVTLTFPSDTTVWDDYNTQVGSGQIDNTLVYKKNVESSVSHIMANQGVAMLRKGVYETGYYVVSRDKPTVDPGEFYSTSYTRKSFIGSDRIHYVKTYSDAKGESAVKNTVTYFVVIYNGSSDSRLYLSSIYDLLPEGYKFYAMVNKGNISGGGPASGSADLWNIWSYNRGDVATLTYGNQSPIASATYGTLLTGKASNFKVTDENPDYTNTVRITNINQQMLTFDVTLDDSHKDASGYYLKPGECIQFGYMCFTGDADFVDTNGVAVNYCAMEYLDYSQEGVKLPDTEKQALNVSNANGFSIENNGDPYIWDNEKAFSNGFTETNANNPVSDSGSGSQRQWLASVVSMDEGEIKPGITKSVDEPDVKSEKDKAATSNWTVTVKNDGNNAMAGYTITETIDAPLYFSGNVVYQINSQTNILSGSGGGKTIVDSYPKENEDSKNYLFNISCDGETTYTIKGNKPGATAKTCNYGAECAVEVCMNIINAPWADWMYYTTIYVNVDKTEEKMTMSIRFDEDSTVAIPAAGEGVLTLETTVPSGTDAGKYTNRADITPVQSWTEKANVGTKDGNSVYATASIDVYTDAKLQSYKEIVYADDSRETVVANSDNYTQADGSADDIPNYVQVTDKAKTVTYRLNVSSDSTLDHLVLLDNLPEPGDYNPYTGKADRGSEFRVDFADNPNVTVKLITALEDADGNVTSSSAEKLTLGTDYTIQYSDKTSFDSTLDGKGTGDNTGGTVTYDGIVGIDSKWHDTLDSATDRSIRINITNKNILNNLGQGKQIVVSFDAVICQEPSAGASGSGDAGSGSAGSGSAGSGTDAAEPGEYAWNSFVFYYNTVGSLIWSPSSPDEVGLAIPGVPELTKNLIDNNKESLIADNEYTFNYIIYKSAESGATTSSFVDPSAFNGDYSADNIGQVLNSKGITEFTYVTVSVAAGASSGKLLLDPETADVDIWTYDTANSKIILKPPDTGGTGTDTGGTGTDTGGTGADTVPWTWEVGAEYAVVEVDPIASSGGKYLFDNIGTNTTNGAYTFTFDNTTNQSITSRNRVKKWSIEITKQDSKDNSVLLSGAVFGLYSSNQDDYTAVETAVKGKLAEYGLSESLATLKHTAADGTEVTYYLIELQETGTGGAGTDTGTGGTGTETGTGTGKLRFNNLFRDEYVVKELKPPDGYALKAPAVTYTFTYEDVAKIGYVASQTVTNESGYELPESGGTGTKLYTICGLLLMVCAAYCGYRLRRKRERRSG